MEKVNENLKAMLKAFNARIILETILAKSLQEYPNPIQEKQCLAEHMDLIKDTQTEWEGPLKHIDHPDKWTPILNPIDENRSIPQE